MAQHAPTSPTAGTILVVDDDALVRDMVQTALTRAGYRVILARDGNTAIELLDIAAPDLILTDLFMPHCDGIELLRSGQLSKVDVPVIAMSGGYAGIDMLHAAKALGAVAAIAKPFMPNELTDLVRRTLTTPEEPARPTAPAEQPSRMAVANTSSR
ncbi:response regulator [Rhodovibrio salinarum]|uniref:Response regulator n=1 Tax=Rhodovibrio salinarum TaxID=1087 RepID=A0A934QG82_9PROT|nr:response regulator [Rhodovibrio salinarum]MBK1696204.1 response regulator [Rhodovibrio salinarum]